MAFSISHCSAAAAAATASADVAMGVLGGSTP
jgi:hypothetical protein